MRATPKMSMHARGGQIYWISVSVLSFSEGDLPKRRNANNIFCLLYPLPCRKYRIKHFPRFIPFNSQSMSIHCNPSAGPHIPISVPDYPSEILRINHLLSYTDPGPCLLCMPSITLTCHPSPALPMCCSLFPCTLFCPSPSSQMHTHTKPLLPIKYFHSTKPHN